MVSLVYFSRVVAPSHWPPSVFGAKSEYSRPRAKFGTSPKNYERVKVELEEKPLLLFQSSVSTFPFHSQQTHFRWSAALSPQSCLLVRLFQRLSISFALSLHFSLLLLTPTLVYATVLFIEISMSAGRHRSARFSSSARYSHVSRVIISQNLMNNGSEHRFIAVKKKIKSVSV